MAATSALSSRESATGTSTVVLTGVTGFLGRRVSAELAERGARVIGLARPSSDTSRLDPRIVVRSGSLDSVDHLFRDEEVHAVIHCATAYGRKEQTLSEILDANVVLPVRLLDLAVAHGTPCFLNADSFFNTRQELPAGLGYYALSKQHFREYGMRVASQQPLKFVNMQIEHMYGPHDSDDKFVPSLIHSLLANVDRMPMTAGEQRRDFVYVDDVAAAFATVCQQRSVLADGVTHMEVGTGVSTSVGEFARLARELCGSRTALDFGALAYRANEIMDSRADTAALARLGWSARVDLRLGLTRTIAAARPPQAP